MWIQSKGAPRDADLRFTKAAGSPLKVQPPMTRNMIISKDTPCGCFQSKEISLLDQAPRARLTARPTASEGGRVLTGLQVERCRSNETCITQMPCDTRVRHQSLKHKLRSNDPQFFHGNLQNPARSREIFLIADDIVFLKSRPTCLQPQSFQRSRALASKALPARKSMTNAATLGSDGGRWVLIALHCHERGVSLREQMASKRAKSSDFSTKMIIKTLNSVHFEASSVSHKMKDTTRESQYHGAESATCAIVQTCAFGGSSLKLSASRGSQTPRLAASERCAGRREGQGPRLELGC